MRGVKNIANDEGWDSLRCTVTNRYDFNGTGAVSIIIYHDGTREIEKILEYAKADYVTMANISEKEVIGLLFERDFEVEGVDPSETPVIEGVEPPLEEFPDWFESL